MMELTLIALKIVDLPISRKKFRKSTTLYPNNAFGVVYVRDYQNVLINA